MKRNHGLVLFGIATITLIAAGCTKKPVASAPATTPQPQQTATNTPAQRETPATTPSTSGERSEVARPRVPDQQTRRRIEELLARIEDAYFDYNKHNLRPDAIQTLEADSKELRDIIVQYPDYKLTIEGHCDERGSAEYNMMLGQARAESARSYLSGVGIPSEQLGLISYGKEKPVCQDHDEPCWQKNRRIHIVALVK